MDGERQRLAGRWRGPVAALLAALWLAGCASIPLPIRSAPEQGPSPAEVRAMPQRFAGTVVRWGGVIAGVKNKADGSIVAVGSRPPSDVARPEEVDTTAGRFLAYIKAFIDPVVYAKGRDFTVVGKVSGVERRKIGEYDYSFPVVQASGYYLWPKRLAPMREPYYYYPAVSPWPYYDPWFPYGR